MCNAWNHYDGCECGFGPPYRFQGTITPGDRSKWINEIPFSKQTFMRGLKEVGLGQNEIDLMVQNYQQAGFPIKSSKWKELNSGEKQSYINTLKRVVGIHKHVIDETHREEIEVPLFMFHAPNVPKSKVTLKEIQSHERVGSWSIRVLGTGMGATQEYKVTCTGKCPCSHGKGKIVFARIPVRIKLISVYEKGRLLSQGHQIAAEKPKKEYTYKRGHKPCEESECRRRIRSEDHPMDEFWLSENTPDDISIFSRAWTTTSSRDIEIGLKISDLDISLKAKVKPEVQLELEYELPGGYDYELYHFSTGHGIAWKVVTPSRV